MEEKEAKGKEIVMQPLTPKEAVVKSTEDEPKQAKLSYEQLENIANQLSNQNRELFQRLRQFENEIFYKRLDYLFKVVENEYSFDDDFVEECANEIKSAIIIPEEKEEEKVEENN